MKILIYSKAFYPSLGGMEISSRHMAKALVDERHIVTVFTETHLDSCAELSEGYGIVRSSSYLSLFNWARWADRIVVRGGVSAVCGLYAFLLRKKICIVHELCGSFYHAPKSISSTLGNFLRLATVYMADMHIGVSQAVLNSKSLPKKAIKHLLYNPSEFEKKSLTSQHNNKTIDILFVGRLIEGKGVEILIRALRLLDADALRITAVIAGDGPLRSSSLSDCENFNHVLVSFPGAVQHNAIREYYMKAKLLVIPSTTHPEGMGIVIAEAFSHSLPVIGSDLLAIREVVGNAGIIIPRGDHYSLSKAIRDLLSSKQMYKDLSDNAFIRASLFDMSSYKDDLHKISESW